MKDMLKLIGIIAVCVLVISASWQLWVLSRKINYAWGYETMVRQTVTQMVKPEALK